MRVIGSLDCVRFLCLIFSIVCQNSRIHPWVAHRMRMHAIHLPLLPRSLLYLHSLVIHLTFVHSRSLCCCFCCTCHCFHLACCTEFRGAGGLLPVQRSIGTRRVKGGVSGLAEALRPVSEVEAGGKFSAGRQCMGAGWLSKGAR